MLQNGFKERTQIARLYRVAEAQFSSAHSCVCVDHREIELLLRSIKIDEEIVDFVEDLLNARVGSVDFIDHDNSGKFGLERLHENVSRLRKRAFARVNQQENTVHHFQRALDLTAKVAVTRRVDDVDLDAVVPDSGSLRQNRDSPLALQLIGIHHALHQLFVGSENSALPQHRVHERRLAMINVSDNGYVSNLVIRHNHPS